MGKKIYFWFIFLLSLFTYYYQFVLRESFDPLPVILCLRDGVLILAGYSLYFNKKIFDAKKWKIIFKALIVVTIGTFIYQIMPGSFYGDFSIFNGSFLTNVFVYLFFLTLYIPLYFAVYTLTQNRKK